MARPLLIAALAGLMLAGASAYAQEVEPQLDGAPPPLQIPKPAPPKPAPPKPVAPKPATAVKPATGATDSVLKAEQDRLARQAEAQKIEQARLASLAADLETRKANLDAREQALAAQEAEYTRKMASLGEQLRPPLQSDPVPPRYRISYDDARRACTRAGMSEALDQDFYSARYEFAPRFFERQREMRGVMRMDDRDGYLSVDTVCQLDANGAVVRFDVLR